MNLLRRARIGNGHQPSQGDAKPHPRAATAKRPSLLRRDRRSRRLCTYDVDDLTERTDRLSDATLPASERSLRSCLAARRGPRPPNLRVRFDAVSVREYNLALGQGCTSCGPPIGLGSKFVSRPPVPLDAYEAAREAYRRESGFPRRSREELRLPTGARVEMLVRAGFGVGEIRDAAREAHEERQLRAKSLRRGGSKYGRLEEGASRLRRGVVVIWSRA